MENGAAATPIVQVADVSVALGGAAQYNVANALGAVAAESLGVRLDHAAAVLRI